MNCHDKATSPQKLLYQGPPPPFTVPEAEIICQKDIGVGIVENTHSSYEKVHALPGDDPSSLRIPQIAIHDAIVGLEVVAAERSEPLHRVKVVVFVKDVDLGVDLHETWECVDCIKLSSEHFIEFFPLLHSSFIFGIMKVNNLRGSMRVRLCATNQYVRIRDSPAKYNCTSQESRAHSSA